MRGIMFAILFLTSAYLSFAQSKLDEYISYGLKNNETIKQQKFQLDQSLYRLKEAKSLFLPSITLNSNYTLAKGGRTIDFPIGDLFNPAYRTLNQLTGTSAFPHLENQSILLNPDNFLDAKIHTSLPIINAEIVYNKKIRQQQFDLQKIEIDIYKRELIKEIKLAYFTYLKANDAVEILASALKIVQENQRINTSLFKNDKVNRLSVIRSENEVVKVNAQLETAKLTKNNAKNYLNFILNNPLDTEIEVEDYKQIPIMESETSVEGREELKKLQIAKEINGDVTRLSRSFQIPKVNAFLDLGTQALDLEFNSRSQYYFTGLALEWSLFSGNKNKFKIRQAELETNIIASRASNVEQQLKLQLQTVQSKFQTSILQYIAAQSQVGTSQKYYDDMLKLYKEGQALFIELLDAQNQLITARLQANISRYETWIAVAEIERSNATFNLK